jgi:hypothetical protein
MSGGRPGGAGHWHEAGRVRARGEAVAMAGDQAAERAPKLA